MKPEEYITRFRMNQENYEFNRQEFIAQLKFDFLEGIQNSKNWDPKTGKLPYKFFKEIVKAYELKFQEISNLKNGRGLSPRLWKAFFATVVVPYRRENYPKIQGFIDQALKTDPRFIDKALKTGKIR